MQYRFEFRPYRRQFKRPLQTSRGIWDVREGIILRLRDKTGNTSWGEIAPLSWFGSETFEQAIDFCHQLPDEITAETIFSIPDALPACQFGFESVWEGGNRLNAKSAKNFKASEGIRASKLLFSGLLSPGEAALVEWEILWYQGYRTFKWKIGVAPVEEELKIFHLLRQALPISAQLRLDANGGLSLKEAKKWLEAGELVGIEFLEQPLPVAQVDAMLELSDRYSTQLALDESVASFEQLEAWYSRGWRGIFVIKPCIVGSPSRLRRFCHEHEIDAVFSSVFETAIGRQAALKLADELSRHNRAVGFGINHYFNQDETWLAHLWNDL